MQEATAAPRGIAASHRYPLIVIALAVLSHGGFALSGQGFTPFYPFIQDDFSLSRTQVGFITGTIFGAATVTSSGFGWMIDRYGVRRTSGFGMMVSGLAVGALYFATNFWILLLVAAAMGSLRPIGHPAGTRAIVDWVSATRRGTAMSIKQAGNPILGSLAAVTIPPLAVAYGWRAAAVALGVFIFAGGVLILATYRDKPSPPAKREVEKRPFWQGMSKVVRNRDITLAVSFGFPMVGAQVATLTYFMLFLEDELGIPVIVAGGMLGVLQASNIFWRIGWGVISDTIGGGRRKPVLYVTVVATAVMLLIMAILPAGTPTWALVLVSLGLGGTVTSWVSVHSVLLTELSEPGQVGITIGYASTASRTGIVVTPMIFGVLADALGYRAAWLTLVGAIVIGFAFLTMVRERPRAEL